MKIYLAGMEPSYLPNAGKAPVLVSFASSSQLRCVGAVEDQILDSGAFTAWTKGRTIDLDAYCDFLRTHQTQIQAALALDVIGGSEAENLANLDHMRQADLGVEVVPVFHLQDPGPGLLQAYLERGCRRIALGGTVKQKPETICRWLDWVFSLDLPAGLRWHGCGITSAQVLDTFGEQFDSVDSTTWLAFAMYGIPSNLHLFAGLSQDCLQAIGAAVMQDRSRPAVPRKKRKPRQQLSFLEALA